MYGGQDRHGTPNQASRRAGQRFCTLLRRYPWKSEMYEATKQLPPHGLRPEAGLRPPGQESSFLPAIEAHGDGPQQLALGEDEL